MRGTPPLQGDVLPARYSKRKRGPEGSGNAKKSDTRKQAAEKNREESIPPVGNAKKVQRGKDLRGKNQARGGRETCVPRMKP